MKLQMKAIAIAAGMLLASGAAVAEDKVAERTDGKTPTYPGIPSDSLEAFGGQAGVDVWVDDLFYYILADNRINQIFKFNGDTAKQQALQNDVLNLVLNSPVDQASAEATFAKYGLNLTRTEYNAELGITVTQFNAVVEDAYLACDAARTPYHVCNQLIAALAPFERVIVTR